MARVTVVNVVAVGDLGSPVDLVRARTALPESDYEPEQFPGLVWKDRRSSRSLLVFGSGKVVVAGARSEVEATAAMSELRQLLLFRDLL